MEVQVDYYEVPSTFHIIIMFLQLKIKFEVSSGCLYAMLAKYVCRVFVTVCKVTVIKESQRISFTKDLVRNL